MRSKKTRRVGRGLSISPWGKLRYKNIIATHTIQRAAKYRSISPLKDASIKK